MDIADRIRNLAETAGVEVECTEEHIEPARCWIDGRVRCPYGEPSGQFIFRPLSFCIPRKENNGCHTYTDRGPRPEPDDDGQREYVKAYFENEKTSVINELRARASELSESTPEGGVLVLAADILEERTLDRNILLEDDLPH